MRHQFHHCAHLHVIDLDIRDVSGARKGGRQALDELCDAKHLAPCVGLAECDVLTSGQKRELLAARATLLREEEGGASPLADAEHPRGAELEELRETLLDERNEIVEENRQRAADAAGALQRNPRPLSRSEEHELGAAGVAVVLDDELRSWRSARLDAIDRALEGLAAPGFGECVRCGGPIELARLCEAPDALVCAACAPAAQPAAERRRARRNR